MDEIKKCLGTLEEARLYWSEKYGREITIEEVHEINENLHNYFTVLNEIANNQKNNENGI